MAEQAQFVNVLKNVGEQMAGLSTTMGAQGVAKIISSFDGGSPKEFKEWIKSIEKYALLTGVHADQIKLVAYQASKGPVSDFLKRYLEANQGASWLQVKTELTTRFAEVTDTQHALMLLRKIKQKQGENIQVYAERLLALADEAYPNQVHAAIDQQLIGFFIDGLQHDYMKMKVMRENPATLQAAITSATSEQNLRRRFELRSNNQRHSSFSHPTGDEPMDISHARRTLRCFKCNRKGHKARECRAHDRANINASNSVKPRPTNVICWYCQGRGHYARNCFKKAASTKSKHMSGQAYFENQGN